MPPVRPSSGRGRLLLLTIETAQPDSRLQRFVRAYVQRRTCAGSHVAAVEPFVARVGVMLDFLFASLYDLPVRGTGVSSSCFRAAIVGPHTHGRIELVARGRIDEVAVVFHAQGFYQLFGEPTSLFADVGTEACGVLGTQIQWLYERLGEVGDLKQRTAILDKFLLQRLRFVPSHDRLSQALDNLVAGAQPLAIKEAATQAGLSIRQMERKSLEHTGLVPKRLYRVARFERALRLKRLTGASWTRIAHDLHYYDQMHMIHEFCALAGDTPTRLLRRMHSDYLTGSI
jgi:AraC-like DNA-binding protein